VASANRRWWSMFSMCDPSAMNEPMTTERCASLAVFYDGACPLCQREIARFHVQHADGRIESGARAFLALWARLPYWRCGGRV